MIFVNWLAVGEQYRALASYKVESMAFYSVFLFVLEAHIGLFVTIFKTGTMNSDSKGIKSATNKV